MAGHHHHHHTKGGDLDKKSPETIYKTVLTTVSANFDGPVAGYTTITSDSKTTHTEATKTSDRDAEKTQPANTKDLPSSLAASNTVNTDGHSNLATATSTPVTQTSDVAKNTGSTQTDAAASSSATPTSGATTSSGTSAGATAGIVIGVLGGILIVALLAFFLFNRRKKQMEEQRALDNEKNEEPFGAPVVTRTASVHTTRTTATAPRLSLRPVTEFNPTFNERRSSKGAGVMLAAAGSRQNAAREKGGSLWERPSTGHSNNPENPFGNDAERPYTPTGKEAQDNPRNPFDSPEHVVGMAQSTDMAAAGAVAGAAAGTSLTRKASVRQETSAPPIDLTMPAGPPSPTGTEFSMNSVAPGQSPGPSKSAAAIAQAGGPPSTAVHRVQLDFNPTMEDEMDIRAGQLVRILHEYDDGWTLCIRLDRSQQGVVPRTCLSTRPVKPRPAGGPPGPRNGGPPINPNGGRGPRGPPGPPGPPGQRPMTPQGSTPVGRPESPMRPPMNGRPQSPAQMRPQSPAQMRPQSPAQMRPHPQAGRPPMGPPGRPQSPANPRPQSPGPRQQRSQSPSGMNPRHNAPGPSPMNPNGPSPRGPPGTPGPGQVGRKPVPGQAY
ncbi:hypothetical protein F5Y16DRAFT_319160 [Xylariaceae sp. FL0255]|nr:hypothetical protein F5Y16DRAFT_319160 [Xylariaceae sp. FL0255]